jgi:AcrR family transcriptional regulator
MANEIMFETTQATRNQEHNGPEDKKQRIINAAKAVFLKYGYGRVTMNDLAQAAGISRPALYLVFSKKEDVFRAVVRHMAREVAGEVSEGLGTVKSPLDKLKFVCEVWMVRPFDWLSQSPEAREIFESSHDFAQEAVAEAMSLFEGDLKSVIDLFPKGTLPKGISHKQAAHLFAGAIAGIKKTCRTSAELREKIHDLIAMTIRA